LRFLSRSKQLLICALSVALAACSEREDPLRDFDLVPDIVDSTQIRSFTVSTSDLDTFFQTTRNNGNRLWAGLEFEAADPAEAKALVRFRERLIPEGAEVLADTLLLSCDLRGDYGDPTPQTIQVHRIISDSWLEDETEGWPFDGHVPLSPPVSFAVGACDTGSAPVSVVLPPSLIAGWIAAPDSNFGLALVANGGGGFKRFLATGSSRPVIGVKYSIGTAPAETLRVRLALTEHATLTRLSPRVENGTGGENAALVAGAFDYRGIVRFDLSGLPVDANINRLRMTLSLDPGSLFLGEDSTRVEIGLHEIVHVPAESLEANPRIVFVTVPATVAVVDAATDTTVTITITRLARSVEKGILLKVVRDFPSLVRFGFVTREGATAPRLEVTYSLPAKIRL
jgi:hypothetical protein